MRIVLRDLKGSRVAVIGDVMLDEYLWGDVQRVSPEAPVPVVELRTRTILPGGAGNVAVNVAALGGEPLLVGILGDALNGDELEAALRERGVSPEGLCRAGGRPTTTKTRVLAHNQQIVRLDREDTSPLPEELQQRLIRSAVDSVSAARSCVISDYAKGAAGEALCRQVVEHARRSGKPVVVDPKSSDFNRYHGASVITPNVTEAYRAAGRQTGEASVGEIGEDLVAQMDGESAILITRGPDGMSLFRAGRKPFTIPTLARRVFDVTGAGDTVAGTLGMYLAAGYSLERAAYAANAAAGIAVGKLGTASVTPAELAAALEHDPVWNALV